MRETFGRFALAATCCVLLSPEARGAVVVDAIEVVQAVQDINAPSPMISGKPTLVRAYLHSTSGRLGLHADLAVDAGGGVNAFIPSTAEVIVTEGAKIVLQRASLSATLDFLVPPKYLAPGTKNLSLAHVMDGKRAPVTCTNCASFSTSTNFVDAPPLHVHVLLVSYTFGPNRLVASPRQVDVDALQSWLTRAFPAGHVVMDTAPFASTDGWPFSCVQLNAQLLSARRRDMESRSSDPYTHYIALVSNTGGFMTGCASDIPQDQPNPAVVASAPAGPPRGRNIPVNATPESDASFAGWYGGHELMHTFGRAHPGMCNGNSQDDDNFPAYARPNGQISPAQPVSVFGYDIGVTSANTHLLSGLVAHDIMTYCNQPDWPSPYTYNAVFARLEAEYALKIPAGGQVASLAPAAPGDAGPTPGANPQPAPAQAAGAGPKQESDAAGAPVRGDFISIQAIANLTRGSAALKFVNQSARGSTTVKAPAAGRTTARLRYVDAKGATVSSYVVAVNPASDFEPGRDQYGLINVTIPEPASAAKIELWFKDKLADSRAILESKPVVKKAPATGGPGSPASIQWNFVNADPGAQISYDIQTSQNGYIWQTFMVGLRDNHLDLSPELAKIPWFRVIANDGAHNSDPVIVKHPPK